jgi:hypothetical protein
MVCFQANEKKKTTDIDNSVSHTIYLEHVLQVYIYILAVLVVLSVTRRFCLSVGRTLKQQNFLEFSQSLLSRTLFISPR